MSKEDKTGFIYIWYDRKHKRYYIGCHIGKENDGYICSSSWMNKSYKYRPEDFKRRILKRNIPKDQILIEEYKWLKLIKDDELGKKYYNISKHHFGHWSQDSEKNLSISEKISIANKGKKYPNRKSPPPFSPEHREKQRLRMLGNTYTLGRNISEKHKQILSQKLTGIKRSDETKAKIANAARKQHEKRSNISNSLKNKID